MPLFATTTVETEFPNLDNFIMKCQQRAFEEDMETKVVILSLPNNGTVGGECRVGDDCSAIFTKSFAPYTDFLLPE